MVAIQPFGRTPAMRAESLSRKRLRPPFVGGLALLVVLLVQPLGHALMVAAEELLGASYLYESAFAVGALGVLLVYAGARKRTEAAGTWLGFFGGSLIWTGWVEFAFHYFARHVGVEPLVDAGVVVTKPEYVVMPASAGLLLSLFVLFCLDHESRCSAFVWLRRRLRLDVGAPAPRHARSYAAITAVETITVTWFFYVVLLLLYDGDLAGERHWATRVAALGLAAWAVYLAGRLVRYANLPAAIRYAIPTAIIGWSVVEILGRWDVFREIWIQPAEYVLEMSVVGVALAILVAIGAVAPPSGRRADATADEAA